MSPINKKGWLARGREEKGLARERTPGIVMQDYLARILAREALSGLASKMDKWTVKECLGNIDEILSELKKIAEEEGVRYDEDKFRSYIGVVTRMAFQASHRRTLGVGGNLSILTRKLKYRDCTGCSNLARKMDAWGPEGCSIPGNMKEILDDMEKRSKTYKLFWPGRTVVKLAILLAIRMTREELSVEDNLELLDTPEFSQWKGGNSKPSPKRRD